MLCSPVAIVMHFWCPCMQQRWQPCSAGNCLEYIYIHLETCIFSCSCMQQRWQPSFLEEMKRYRWEDDEPPPPPPPHRYRWESVPATVDENVQPQPWKVDPQRDSESGEADPKDSLVDFLLDNHSQPSSAGQAHDVHPSSELRKLLRLSLHRHTGKACLLSCAMIYSKSTWRWQIRSQPPVSGTECCYPHEALEGFLRTHADRLDPESQEMARAHVATLAQHRDAYADLMAKSVARSVSSTVPQLGTLPASAIPDSQPLT